MSIDKRAFEQQIQLANEGLDLIYPELDDAEDPVLEKKLKEARDYCLHIKNASETILDLLADQKKRKKPTPAVKKAEVPEEDFEESLSEEFEKSATEKKEVPEDDFELY